MSLDCDVHFVFLFGKLSVWVVCTEVIALALHCTCQAMKTSLRLSEYEAPQA